MSKFFALFFMLSIAPCILAQELKVVTENWRPYNYEEAGEIKGTSTDQVKKILKKAGFKFNISVYPWSRAYDMALNEENILIFTLIRIAPREKLFKWACQIGKPGRTSLYRIKGNSKVNPKTVEEAKKFSIVTNIDSMDDVWLTFNNFTKLEKPATVTDSFNMIFGKRTELLSFDEVTLEAELKAAGHTTDELEHVLTLFETPPYLAVSLKTSDKILKKIKAACNKK